METKNQITYVLAKNTEEDFHGYSLLEEDFNKYYNSLHIGEQYGRISFKDFDPSRFKKEYEDRFLNSTSFTLFAKDGDSYVGYLEGNIEDNAISYQEKRIGCLDFMTIHSNYRGSGIGTTMRDLFFEWLRHQNIAFCKLMVKVNNIEALGVYKKWGFESDEINLWKKI